MTNINSNRCTSKNVRELSELCKMATAGLISIQYYDKKRAEIMHNPNKDFTCIYDSAPRQAMIN